MTGQDYETSGQRIARARRRRGLSEAAFAGLVGRSESWLSQVERGRRPVDSHSVLTRLASALHVPVEELTGDASPPVRSTARAIEHAMMAYQIGPSVGGTADPRSGLRYLQAAAAAAYADYQATRYEQATELVASLIREAESAPATTVGWQVRALVYDTAAALLNRTGQRGARGTLAHARAAGGSPRWRLVVAVAVAAWMLLAEPSARFRPHRRGPLRWQ
jgi:transcriptional regulator with XRE-family HTH domain